MARYDYIEITRGCGCPEITFDDLPPKAYEMLRSTICDECHAAERELEILAAMNLSVAALFAE